MELMLLLRDGHWVAVQVLMRAGLRAMVQDVDESQVRQDWVLLSELRSLEEVLGSGLEES